MPKEKRPVLKRSGMPIEVAAASNPLVAAARLAGRVWFMSNVVVAFASTYIAAKAIHLLYFWGTWDQKCGLTTCACCLSFRIAYMLCPWISFEGTSKLNYEFNDLRIASRKCGGALLMTNHTSLMDAFVIAMLLPFDIAYKTRTLAKSSLFKTPIVGEVFRLSGHFPVYFTSGENSNFSVDKEKQAKVAADTTRFLRSGGVMLFCPEGQIERDTPHKIQALRRGSFTLSAQHNLPIFTSIVVGNYEVWPTDWMLGGLPALIHVKARCVLSPAQVKATMSEKALDADEVKARTVELAEMTSVKMQEDLDELFEDSGRRERFGAAYDARLKQRLALSGAASS